MPLDRQPTQKHLNFLLAHALRMTQAMEADEGYDPIDIGFFGAYALLQVADPPTHLVQQPSRWRAAGAVAKQAQTNRTPGLEPVSTARMAPTTPKGQFCWVAGE